MSSCDKGNFRFSNETATREHTSSFLPSCRREGPFFKLLQRKEKEES